MTKERAAVPYVVDLGDGKTIRIISAKSAIEALTFAHKPAMARQATAAEVAAHYASGGKVESIEVQK